jgi:hypothetical protein
MRKERVVFPPILVVALVTAGLATGLYILFYNHASLSAAGWIVTASLCVLWPITVLDGVLETTGRESATVVDLLARIEAVAGFAWYLLLLLVPKALIARTRDGGPHWGIRW